MRPERRSDKPHGIQLQHLERASICLCLCHGDRAAVALQTRMGGCCGKAAQARAASQPRDTDEKRTAAWGGMRRETHQQGRGHTVMKKTLRGANNK